MSDRPGILWIYCDELRADALGCYGNEPFQPKTPNLDALAAAGSRFDRCYCNSPVCVPSRVSTMTGLHPEQTGVYHNEAAWDGFEMPVELTTFPEVFAEYGYTTADFGKIHLPPGMQPWQHEDRGHGGMGGLRAPMEAAGKEIIRPRGVPTMLGGRYDLPGPYPPEQVTDSLAAWLDGQEGPFLARASYLQPHTPVFPPPPYDELYADVDFPEQLEEIGDVSAFERRFAELTDPGNLTPRQVRLTQQYYYGLVAWVDAQVGRLMEALRETGLAERTVVVFTADHGAALGEGGRFAKHVFAPEVHRVPLIVAGPDCPVGEVRPDICEGIDLPRTLMARAGIPVPDSFGGRDLMGSAAPEAVFSTIGFGRPESRAYPNKAAGGYVGGRGWPRRSCVRTMRYRLDRNVRIDGRAATSEEFDTFLADSRDDPRERTNLAGRPELAEIQQRLERMLSEHVSDAVE